MTARDTIWSPGSRLRYMPQLDALRAIAVGLVVVYHFWRPARQSLHFGSIGVRIFFVLSGFLITGILLEARRELDAGRTSPGAAVRRFYLRRVLRIFPVYYLVLAIAWAGNVVGAREGIAWHAAYLSNLYFFRLSRPAGPGVPAVIDSAKLHDVVVKRGVGALLNAAYVAMSPEEWRAANLPPDPPSPPAAP